MNPGAAQPNVIASLMPIIFIFGIFYFLLIRPQQKKQKDHEKVIQELKKNDEVVTSGGVHGTIVNVKDNTFVVRIDDNVKVEINKSAVSYLKKSR
ncbi:MAG: preprotein translocase subunit YajC [Candidatus Gorgyraea atricola]|nr:preprotein translocase subunit YajC [Candidatus Gorgyraea atricola]